jgi:hypothetical protein
MGEFVETSETAVPPAALGHWRLPLHRPLADPESIARAAKSLLSSSKVCIVAGDGAALSGCGAEVLALAEALQAPIATSLGARGIIPTTHPLAVGVVGNYSAPPANQVVHAADLVLFIGCDTGDQVTHTWRVPRIGTRVVQIDADPLEFERSYATEVALLGISATRAGQGMPIWSIMVFPALFAAGMSLIDTTDGVLMLGAYNWAFVKPIRKLYYNLVITAVSVVVAVLIGGIEGLGLIGGQLGLDGWFWDGIGVLNDNFSGLGFVIIGVFIFAWIASVIVYRYARLDTFDAAPTNR